MRISVQRLPIAGTEAPQAGQYQASAAAAPDFPAPHPPEQLISTSAACNEGDSSRYETAPDSSSPIDKTFDGRLKPDHEKRSRRVFWI